MERGNAQITLTGIKHLCILNIIIRKIVLVLAAICIVGGGISQAIAQHATIYGPSRSSTEGMLRQAWTFIYNGLNDSERELLKMVNINVTDSLNIYNVEVNCYTGKIDISTGFVHMVLNMSYGIIIEEHFNVKQFYYKYAKHLAYAANRGMVPALPWEFAGLNADAVNRLASEEIQGLVKDYAANAIICVLLHEVSHYFIRQSSVSSQLSDQTAEDRRQEELKCDDWAAHKLLSLHIMPLGFTIPSMYYYYANAAENIDYAKSTHPLPIDRVINIAEITYNNLETYYDPQMTHKKIPISEAKEALAKMIAFIKDLKKCTDYGDSINITNMLEGFEDKQMRQCMRRAYTSCMVDCITRYGQPYVKCRDYHCAADKLMIYNKPFCDQIIGTQK